MLMVGNGMGRQAVAGAPSRLGWASRLYRAIAEQVRLGGKAVSMVQVVLFRSLAMAVNIGTSMLTAAVLGPDGRGEQAALVLAPMFLGGLAALGLHGAVIYNIKADPGQERALLGNSILLAGLSGGIAAAGGWIAEPYWLAQYSAHTIMVGRLLLVVTPLIVIGWVVTGAAEAKGWFGLVNRMLYLQSLLTLALLGALAWLHALTPMTSALTYTLPMVLMVGYLFAQVVRRIRPAFRPRRGLAARLLHYGARLCGVDIVNSLATYFDQLIIVAFLPAGMVGTYVVAVSSARVLNVVSTGISAVLFPSVAAREISEIVRTVATTFRLATPLIAVLAAILSLIGPPLLLLAYGAKFAPAIMPFHVLLVTVVVENSARILYPVYSGSGRPGLVTAFEGAAIVLMLLVMLALVPVLGTLGAAISLFCAGVFRLLVAMAGLPLLLKVRLPRLVLDRSDLRMIRTVLGRPVAAVPGLEPAP